MNTVLAILITQFPIAIACIIIALELRQLKKDFIEILNKLTEFSKHQKKR